jgi:hypothetical protein
VRIELRDLDLRNNRSGHQVGIFNDPKVGGLDVLRAAVAVERQSAYQAVDSEIVRPGDEIVFRHHTEVGALEVVAAARVMSRIENEEVGLVGSVHSEPPLDFRAKTTLTTFGDKIKRVLCEDTLDVTQGVRLDN